MKGKKPCAHTFTPQILYHLPLSHLKMPGDTMFFLFDVPRLCLSWLTDWVTWAREVIWLLWWRPFAQPLALLAHSTEDSSSAAHPFTLLNLIISLQFLPPGNRLINTHTLCPDPVFSHKLITASDLLPALRRLGYIGLTLWENPVMTHIWQAE